MEKTKVFNLIILDKSGSMERLHHAAVKGFNEVTDGIRQSQEEHRATQEHHVGVSTPSSSLQLCHPQSGHIPQTEARTLRTFL